MAVQQEIKSQLAKLLATEDLIVEHKNCETASFNVHTRLLTLPMWDKASNTVYDVTLSNYLGEFIAGEEIVPCDGPELPAATTTCAPVIAAASTILFIYI